MRIWRDLVERKIFHNYLEEGVFDLDSICRAIEKYEGPLLRLTTYYQAEEGDYRHGYITYGYKTIESIENNLKYISDRWRAAFRLMWLLNVPMEVGKLRRKNPDPGN